MPVFPSDNDAFRLHADDPYASEVHVVAGAVSSPFGSPRSEDSQMRRRRDGERLCVSSDEFAPLSDPGDEGGTYGDSHRRPSVSSPFPSLVVVATADYSGDSATSESRASPADALAVPEDSPYFFESPVTSNSYTASEALATSEALAAVACTPAVPATGCSSELGPQGRPAEAAFPGALHLPGPVDNQGRPVDPGVPSSGNRETSTQTDVPTRPAVTLLSSVGVSPCLYGRPCDGDVPEFPSGDLRAKSHAKAGRDPEAAEKAYAGGEELGSSVLFEEGSADFWTSDAGYARSFGRDRGLSRRANRAAGRPGNSETSAARSAATMAARLAFRVAARVATVAETLHGHWRRLRAGPGGFTEVEGGYDEDQEEFNAESEETPGSLRRMTQHADSREADAADEGRGHREGRFFWIEGQENGRAGHRKPSADVNKYEKWKCIGVEQTSAGVHPRENQRLCSLVFALIFLLEVFVNFDCGAVPASLSEIALHFRLSTTWQGLVGALPYVGLTLASPFVGRLLTVYRPRSVIISTMALNVVAMLLLIVTYAFPGTYHEFPEPVARPSPDEEASSTTTVQLSAGSSSDEAHSSGYLFPSFPSLPAFGLDDLTPSAWLLLTSRFFVGITQAAFVIYAPVWVDEFAPPQYAALWMGIVQGAAVVGVTVGYLATAFLCIYLLLDWRWAFLLQAVVCAALVAALAELPSEAIDASSKMEESGSEALQEASSEAEDTEVGHCDARPRQRIADARRFREASRSARTLAFKRGGARGGVSENLGGHMGKDNRSTRPVQGLAFDPRLAEAGQTDERGESANAELDWMHDSADETALHADAGSGEGGAHEREDALPTLTLHSFSQYDKTRGIYTQGGCEGTQETGRRGKGGDSRGQDGEVHRELNLQESRPITYVSPKGRFPADSSHKRSLPRRELRVLMIEEQEEGSADDEREVHDSRTSRGGHGWRERRAERKRRDEKTLSACAMMKQLAKNPLYILPVFTLSALLFVVTGVQFWGTVHLTSNLQLTPSVAMLTFAAVAASAPTAGVIGGGIMVDRLGGYKTLDAKLKTLQACLAAAAAAVVCGFVGAVTTDALTFVLSLWFLLCFGGALLPPLTGLQIAAVETPLRTFASGLSMFTYNICGYALGTFLPGAVMDFVKGDTVGMRLILFWSLFGLVGVFMTAMSARRMRDELAATNDSRTPSNQEASSRIPALVLSQ
ncbi:transporter, major facilitator family protein [Toxoplasma gondii VAND]|uniref:Transporter, major facilitator family protein n=1 Tax=Toxoplasma gondii VAND TaxID=933077 RepID=A0A086QEG4_TOXGO|nr:transporter, major facilitator family protein [Toxoplasma gondii VAND]